MSSYLLTPLHATGDPVAEQPVVEEWLSASDFDWTWGQYCVSYLPDGNLMVFDNGFLRHYVVDGEMYSRVVIYHIDEAVHTVKQVWDYERERGADTYSGFLSSAVY